ncbi:histidine--tRNA ligase [Granulosicoccus antarcticus]|uniref:Histidine--tRNA ligase n=1 Tax=Granulosicoccus antarcticus IMCC3135 TaxID=1192854 RepID=A0A2Z2NTK5_9GAMM|nr:histidine--tRNA ligase [Granulosicoccus antarcticus]ASJ74882.1 Histidine--tRNA ligase [Granulosicoccus antarcticus IMCC3135]
MKIQFTRLRGMPDIVPQAVAPWQKLEAAARHAMRAYGYGELRTPVIERTSLFTRSIGEATDIVEKEMYTFSDRKGESMSLRPENTAGCVRAAIENGLLQPGSVNRIWYTGPMFRYERPQLGRQRQFFQTGAEVYGLAGPAIEAELILLSARLWRELGIYDAMQLEINTLGDVEDRVLYREKLVAWFEQHREILDEDSLRRLERNPLRILDSKNPVMQEMINAAPKLRDSLSEASLAHFDELQALLKASGIDVVINPRLVRGLDYYSHTVFEWTTTELGSQSAVCAGGRYDGLLTQLGAKDMPGVGWAFGMERVIALMDKVGVTPAADVPDIFVMGTDEVGAADSLALAELIRGLLPQCSVVHNTAAGSLKSQFRKADKSGASLAAIIGSEELEQGRVTIKPLRGAAEQVTVTRQQLEFTLNDLLNNNA